MSKALLVDFGSTYTKTVIVDLVKEEIIASGYSLTTVDNIVEGLEKSLFKIGINKKGLLNDFKLKIACSSAAGGLRMISIGLVKELTAEAAKRASLGAGARVLKTYSFKLTSIEIKGIEDINPDIILLAGGTDGGEEETILYNSQLLAESSISSIIVIAGNKVASERVKEIFQRRGKSVVLTENVMPEIGELNIEPAKASIRQIYIDNIVEAKGLKKAEEILDCVLMPTPAAVLKAATLIAEGIYEEKGLGELIVIDIGGATTDVHSIAKGESLSSNIIFRGLPEPYAKRTVEGDLGMRVSAISLIESAGKEKVFKNAGLNYKEINLNGIAKKLSTNIGFLPQRDLELAIEQGLACTAAELAVERHVGILKEIFTPNGRAYIQHGKDLTNIKYVICSGGAMAYSYNPDVILRKVLFNKKNPFLLKPKNPEFMIDKKYILWAIGLLAEKLPRLALRIAKKYLVKIENITNRPTNEQSTKT
jgi:uncharacterized protein (TIGR01319 family)